MYWLNKSLVIVVILAASACSEIPKTNLQSYTDAFAEAKGAAELVMVELSVARDRIEKFKAEKSTPKKPLNTARIAYVPPVRFVRTQGENAIASRLTALGVIDQYNQMLVAIAEGKNQDEIKERVTTVATVAGKVALAAGTAIPGVQALTGLLQTLAVEYQEYRDREIFVRKLREGAPYVKQILDFFIDDTPSIVNVHDGLWDVEEAPLGRKPTSLARRLLAMARTYKLPVAPTDLKRVTDLENQASDLLTQFSGTPIKLRWSSDVAAVAPKSAELNELEAIVAEMKGAVAAYSAHQEKYVALRALMDQYTTLLKRTIDSIDQLTRALDRPVDMSAVIVGLLDSSLRIKMRFSAYRAALRSP